MSTILNLSKYDIEKGVFLRLLDCPPVRWPAHVRLMSFKCLQPAVLPMASDGQFAMLGALAGQFIPLSQIGPVPGAFVSNFTAPLFKGSEL